MVIILTRIGAILFSLCTVAALVAYTNRYNRFLDMLKESHADKWREFGSLEKHSLGFSNKKARAEIHKWIRHETGTEYRAIKEVYSPVSRLETITSIIALVTIACSLFLIYLVTSPA